MVKVKAEVMKDTKEKQSFVSTETYQPPHYYP